MTRSKKIFLGFVAAFAVFIVLVSYDISRRTTFPGSKSQLKERIRQKYVAPDSAEVDSARTRVKR
ncbi:MAG TPA: hypothetical protein DCE81_09130 [Cytophagales bacterium]|nr:hypothetical protein [Cytophagales bacterium]